MPTHDRDGLGAGGGWERAWSAPQDADGNRTTLDSSFITDEKYENMVGCHAGPFLGFNIVNPQPGCEYDWPLDNESGHMLAEMRGGEPVRVTDPDQAGLSYKANAQTSLDGLVRHRGHILYRYTEKAVRQRREAEAAAALSQLHGGEARYVGGASEAERGYAKGRPTRFRRRDHHSETKSGGGDGSRTLDYWTPDKGVIEEG